MALSGDFYKYPVSDAPWFGLYCTWSGAQNVSGNYTDITVNVYLSYYNIDVGAKVCTVSAGGGSLTFTSPRIYHYNQAWTKKPLGSVDLRVYHDDDGSKKNCAISVTFPFDGYMAGVSVPSITASVSVDLDRIPRVSNPTVSSESVYLGEKITIYTNRTSTAFTHTLEFTFGNARGTIAAGVGDSAPWYPDVSLAAQIPSVWSGKGTVTCKTYHNGSLIGTGYVDFVLMVPDDSGTKPAVSISSAVPVNSLAAPFHETFVQGLTKVSAAYSVSVPNSTLQRVELSLLDPAGAALCTAAGGDFSAESGTITSSGTITVKVTAYNGRGQSSSDAVQIFVEEYAPPRVDVSLCCRCDDLGTPKKTGLKLKLTASRIFSSLNGQNRCELRYRIKKYDGTPFSSSAPWTSLLSASDTTTDTYSGILCSVEKKSAYSIEIGAVDSVGKEGSAVKYVATSLVALHLGKDGNRAAFGQYAEEEDLLDVAWNERVRKDLRVDGKVFIGGSELSSMFYPVGSIYMSVSEVSPALLFGGTWERIAGRFLLAAGDGYPAGSTGGASTVTLTEEHLPSHTHSITIDSAGEHSHQVGYDADVQGGGEYSSVHRSGTSGASGTALTSSDGGHVHTGTIGSSGDGKAHSIMPPYVAVFVWKRIS